MNLIGSGLAIFRKVSYEPITEHDPLRVLLQACKECLRENIHVMKYPSVLRGRQAINLWELQTGQIDSLNSEVLVSLTGRGGVYAIYVAKPNEDWDLKYVGQAKGTVLKQRIRSHLVWRNKATKSGKFTGSKFDEVQSHISLGYDVAFSFIEIAPESLRHYVEEMILARSHPEWNFHGTTLEGQNRSKKFCSIK